MIVSETDFNKADTAQLVAEFRDVTTRLRSEVGRIIVGQDEVVEHLLITLLVGGHCLVTGMPGTAKTLLVRTLADALGLQSDRIQFTPDLMPTDITGTDIIEDGDDGKRGGGQEGRGAGRSDHGPIVLGRSVRRSACRRYSHGSVEPAESDDDPVRACRQ